MPVMIFIDKEEKRLKAVIIAAFKILPSCENLISINRIGELGAGVLTPREEHTFAIPANDWSPT